MLTVTIHQPGYLPWLGFFDKMAQSDIFVLLDDVQYEKNWFDNRNKIKTANGPIWLTIPVKVSFGQRLNEVGVENKLPWRRKHYQSICDNYRRTPYFERYQAFFQNLYEQEWNTLIDLNLAIIQYLRQELGLKTKLIRSSGLRTNGQKGDRILEICDQLGADRYLSGQFGRNYLDEKKFEAKNIRVVYQDFHHPVYRQLFGDFLPALAAIDLLFNCGPDSAAILSSSAL